MKRKKLWIFALLIGIMTLSTICYISMVRNAKTSYANGRFVEQEGTGDEIEYYLLKTGTE